MFFGAGRVLKERVGFCLVEIKAVVCYVGWCHFGFGFGWFAVFWLRFVCICVCVCMCEGGGGG